jgi:hypothetical protein
METRQAAVHSLKSSTPLPKRYFYSSRAPSHHRANVVELLIRSPSGTSARMRIGNGNGCNVLAAEASLGAVADVQSCCMRRAILIIA